MKKILVVATVVKTHIMQFHIPVFKMLKEKGWNITVAAKNDYETDTDCNIPCCDEYIDVPFKRFPFHPENLSAYKKLKKIIRSGDFDIVHCHTPVGGVLARLAAKSERKNGVKVFYTAHGFHFYKGASLLNWLLYYPVEKFLSNFTDILITINSEDYNISNKFHAKENLFVNGVGVSVDRISKAVSIRAKICEEFKISQSAMLLLSVGELTKNKNHKTIIKALSMLNNEQFHYIIAGNGTNKEKLKKYAENLKVENRVHFLGYRNDIPSIIKSCDIFCFPSRREGLPVALMEAMAGGLPIVASDVRGNRELVKKEKGGFLYNCDDVKGFCCGIERLASSEKLRDEYGQYNMQEVKKYEMSRVMEVMKKLYM